MAYFVTGGTGFIGRHLIEKLLEREGDIFVLVRDASKGKLKKLKQKIGDIDDRVKGISGDLTLDRLGVSDADVKLLSGKVKHFFHVAAIYDLNADYASQEAANVEGTRRAIDVAESIKAGCFHHVSSIAAAGVYNGVFREDMFEEAEGLKHPYFRTKHDSEGLVRKHCDVPWRVYRPGMVLGHSETGEIDKIDGPYYFFKLIQKMRDMLPPWVPTIGLEGSRLNMVPVDYVVDAMDYIAHLKGRDGECFHLTDPKPKRIGEVLNIFARAGHAPLMTMRVDARLFSFVPPVVKQGVQMVAPVRRITDQIFRDLGMPRDVLTYINYPTRFDNRNAEAALQGSGIKVPDLESYAYRLWDYWERNLDPDLFIDRTLSGRVKGKKVLITGASSGIGKASALKVAEAGGEVLLVARTKEKLEDTLTEIKDLGGKAEIYVADVSDMLQCDRLVEEVLADHKHLDILINNAGRSIRRSIHLSYDRFHDFERTMQLNYFGSLRLIMGFLPSMTRRKKGHIINISSIGVLSNAPRFSAYVASKAALDAFSRCAASEFNDQNISFTTINMPLVRTPMIAPTKMYDNVPTITPDDAADMVADAIIRRPQRIATRLGIFAQVCHALAPKMMEVIMNSAFRLFPDSAAAQGNKEGGGEAQPTQEQIAFASIMRGIHW
jgi:NAD(P)-dependent dehydrogenase (short-subunit alcohol dehydrogenase family)